MEETTKVQLKKKINKNYKYLIRETQLEDLIDGFVAAEVFTYDDRELIMNVQPSTTNERNRKFLDLMFRKGQWALDIFLQELIECGRDDAVKRIKGTEIEDLSKQEQSEWSTEKHEEKIESAEKGNPCLASNLKGMKITSTEAGKQIKTRPRSYITHIVSYFRLDKPVTLVATVDSSKAWFGCHSDSYLSLVTAQGSIIKTLKLNFKVDHIALDLAGDLLMTVFEGHHIKKLTKFGDIVDVLDTFPLQSRGICVNDLGEIWVCLSTNSNGISEVRKISSNGKALQIIRYKKGTTTPLFRSPFRVKQSNTGDICILDAAVTSDSRQFIILEPNGQIKFTYPADVDPRQNKFNPMNIEIDDYGNILIGDTTYGIHLLDKDGNFVQLILSESQGLEISRGLSIDPSGRLWVCSVGNDKIFIVKYFQDNNNLSYV